jgi:hypothetical protein
MRNTVYFMLLMGIIQVVSVCSFLSVPKPKINEPQKYALLIGGGVTEGDNFESFYCNIEYVSNTLKKLGYGDEDIKILFYGGKTAYHPIVEGNAKKENFIDELRLLGHTVDSNDSLVIFRSGHGMVELVYEKITNNEHGAGVESMKYVGTEALMRFPDGNLSYLEFHKILEKIRGKQIIIILNQCFAGQFADIALSLDKTVVITETSETELAINDIRKTVRWKHDVWPFVKCFFDGFLQNGTKGEKQSVFDAFQYMLRCNPSVEGMPVQADRPLLKEKPQIKYGSSLKKGTVYIY